MVIYSYLELSIDGRYIKLVTAIDNTIVKIEVPTILDGGSEILHHQTDGWNPMNNYYNVGKPLINHPPVITIL